MTTQYRSCAKTEDVLIRERNRTLANAVRKLASSIYYGTVERAFERVGCSCAPYRTRLEELEARYETQIGHLRESLDNSDLGREIRELKEKVQETDRAEHAALNDRARQAYFFLPVWLLDEVRQGRGGILDSDHESLAKAYSEAWIGGWRPEFSNEKPRKSRGYTRNVYAIARG